MYITNVSIDVMENLLLLSMFYTVLMINYTCAKEHSSELKGGSNKINSSLQTIGIIVKSTGKYYSWYKSKKDYR